MKAADLKLLERGELQARLTDLQQQYRTLRLSVLSGREKSSAKLKLMRRDIARVKTLL